MFTHSSVADSLLQVAYCIIINFIFIFNFYEFS